MEVPILSLSSVSGLNYHVSSKNVKISVSSHSRNNIEISLNIQTESSVEFSLSWISLPLVSIDDVPLGSKMVGSLSSIDILVLFI
jgi:hypothetical protein